MGMEVNNPKFSQRRTSVIKFLGELYNYRIIDSALIFKVGVSDILYKLIFEKHSFDNLLMREKLLPLKLHLIYCIVYMRDMCVIISLTNV